MSVVCRNSHDMELGTRHEWPASRVTLFLRRKLNSGTSSELEGQIPSTHYIVIAGAQRHQRAAALARRHLAAPAARAFRLLACWPAGLLAC